MFGKKARLIKELQHELEEKDKKLNELQNTYKKMFDKMSSEHAALVFDLTKAKARLREIQDKSNARTRKCRANKKKEK